MYRVKDNQEMEIVKDEWGSNRIVRFSVDGGDGMDENIFGADVDNDMVVTPKLTLEFEVVNRQDYPNIYHIIKSIYYGSFDIDTNRHTDSDHAWSTNLKQRYCMLF